jgi:LuxR family maltose regulon positive regulatory protein
VKQALALSQAVKDAHVQRDALRIMAVVQQAQGYGDVATKTMRQADEFLKGKYQPANAFQVNALTHLQLALMAGDLDLASRWQDRLDELNPESKPIQIGLIANAGCLMAIPDILKNQLLIIKGQKEMAAHYLAELNQIALEQQLGYCRLAILVLQAMASPDPVSASSFLNMALSLGQEEDHMRLFIDHGSSLLRLLRSSNIEDANISYKNKLISSFPPPTQLLGPEMPTQIDTAQPLTDRELEILQLLAKHQTNAEISQSLVISANTVKTHLQHIYEKLNVHNRRAAVNQARQLGLL